MNIILYLTILFLFLLFSFLFIYNEYKECFTQDNDNDYDYEYRFDENLSNRALYGQQVYNQMYEFIPDKYNYDFNKDSGMLKDVRDAEISEKVPITLGEEEFYNLKKKIGIKNKLTPKDIEIQKKIKIDKMKILKANKQLTDYPLIRRELDILEIDSVLMTIEDEYSISKEDYHKLGLIVQDIKDVEYSYSYDLIKKWLTTIISREANKQKYHFDESEQYFDNTQFKYMNDNLLSYKLDIHNKIEEFKFQMRLYRDNKRHHFIVYFETLFNYVRSEYYINNIILLGIDIEENIKFNTYKSNEFKETKDGVHLSMIDISDNELLNRYNGTDAFIEENKKKEVYEYDRHMCFKKEALDKNNCISPSIKNMGVGVWDEPCLYDEDCPFYRKNLNYPNNRGGCIKGHCEMPVNVGRIGFKHTNTTRCANRPLCYNCKIKGGCIGLECNMCCEDQKNRDMYPSLKSPDYVFENDFNKRIGHSSKFTDKEMKPIILLA